MSNPNESKSIKNFKEDAVNGETIKGGGADPAGITDDAGDIFDDTGAMIPGDILGADEKKGKEKINEDGTYAGSINDDGTTNPC